MAIELRPARPEEMGQIGELAGYVYGGAFGDGPDSMVALATRPDWTTCAFDGDRLVASYAVIPFTMRANGTAMALGGVSAVGTLPEYRRRGLVRAIATESLESMRQRGQSVAALWASQAAIYQRYGYAMTSMLRQYRVDTTDIGFHDDHAVGDRSAGTTVTRHTVENGRDTVKSVYNRYVADRIGYLHRARPLWDNNTFGDIPADGPVHVAIATDADDHPVGYGVYTLRAGRVDHAARPQELAIRDLAWLNIDAYRELWRFFARHDLVGRVRWDSAPIDDPAPELFSEPRLLHAVDREGVWLRVVDVATACAARGFDINVALSFDIAEDTLAPWNVGTYRLSVRDGEVDVDQGASKADLQLSIKAFASLFTGRHSARRLRAWGMLTGTDHAVAAADALFATRHAPHCPDHF